MACFLQGWILSVEIGIAVVLDMCWVLAFSLERQSRGDGILAMHYSVRDICRG